MKQQVDSIVSASHVVTVDDHNTVLSDHAVVVRDGTIVAIAPRQDVLQRFMAHEHVHLDCGALLPGFVNAHVHSPMALMRGFADDMPLPQWLASRIWPAEGRYVDRDFVIDGSRLAIAEMLRSGTTCFADMYFFCEDTAGVAIEVGIRASLGLIVLDFPTCYAASPSDYFTKARAAHAAFSGNAKVHFTVAPHAPYTVREDDLVAAHHLACELDVPLHTHLHETQAEVDDSLAGASTPFAHKSRQRSRPLANFERLGLLDPRLMAVHMTQLTSDEIALLAQRQCHVVHAPSSNLKLASGLCPIDALDKAGVCVALGTDGAASNNTLDMMGEMRLAALLAKGVAGRADAIPAATAVRLATINGAKALGLDRHIGSLEVGKSADMILLDLDAPETQPLFDVVSHIVYACDRRAVRDLWVGGRRLLNNRQLTTLDLDAVLAAARSWQSKLMAL